MRLSTHRCYAPARPDRPSAGLLPGVVALDPGLQEVEPRGASRRRNDRLSRTSPASWRLAWHFTAGALHPGVRAPQAPPHVFGRRTSELFRLPVRSARPIWVLLRQQPSPRPGTRATAPQMPSRVGAELAARLSRPSGFRQWDYRGGDLEPRPSRRTRTLRLDRAQPSRLGVPRPSEGRVPSRPDRRHTASRTANIRRFLPAPRNREARSPPR